MKRPIDDMSLEQIRAKIEEHFRSRMEPGESMDFCKPLGNGLYKTGNLTHGEGIKKMLQKMLVEEANRMLDQWEI